MLNGFRGVEMADCFTVILNFGQTSGSKGA